jgi:hypothetical protein
VNGNPHPAWCDGRACTAWTGHTGRHVSAWMTVHRGRHRGAAASLKVRLSLRLHHSATVKVDLGVASGGFVRVAPGEDGCLAGAQLNAEQALELHTALGQLLEQLGVLPAERSVRPTSVFPSDLDSPLREPLAGFSAGPGLVWT